LIYLCTLSFNGIYRQNLSGDFNVPYGFKTHLHPCDESKIIEASQCLESAKLTDQDFTDAVRRAKTGDVVYFDPPYTVAHGNNGFVKYNAKIFSWDDQKRLSRVARRLADKGCAVFVSNADHDSIHQLYKEFSVRVIDRRSVIAASSDFRKGITECVFFSR
jgi:DNA adenine methylase